MFIWTLNVALLILYATISDIIGLTVLIITGLVLLAMMILK